MLTQDSKSDLPLEDYTKILLWADEEAVGAGDDIW